MAPTVAASSSASTSTSTSIAGKSHPRSDSTSPPREKKLKIDGDQPAVQAVDASNSESNSNDKGKGKGKSFFNPSKASARRIKNNRKTRLQNLLKTSEDPIFFDALKYIGEQKLREIIEQGQEWREVYRRGEVVEVEILALGAHGEGIALNTDSDWLITVPFVLPGEKVSVRVNENERLHSKGEMIEKLSRNPHTDVAGDIDDARFTRMDELVRCKYFGKCGGCQYQMTAYNAQLLFKQEVVRKAFQNYSDLPPSLLPPIGETLPSPSEYSYRTKLTPHFNLPKSVRESQKGSKSRSRKSQPKPADEEAEEAMANDKSENKHDDLVIGFDTPKGVSISGNNGSGGVLDIEECSIATKTINDSLEGERKRIKDTIGAFKNGSTLLMRDSLASFDHISDASQADDLKAQVELISKLETVTITDHKAPVKECVGSIKFQSNAGSFFQNNRSILPSLIDYVKSQVVTNQAGESRIKADNDRYLVDAYCGSGLFSLCLADLFKEVSGVEISQDSIKWAKINAEQNSIKNTKFLAGNAEDIFGTIDYPSEKTTVVIDEAFINQLVKLGPKHIIYVSCNVHTQARDVGQLIRAAPEYEILSIRGADLFPQTHHVEGICVLKKRSEGDSRSHLEGFVGNLSLAKSINQNK